MWNNMGSKAIVKSAPEQLQPFHYLFQFVAFGRTEMMHLDSEMSAMVSSKIVTELLI